MMTKETTFLITEIIFQIKLHKLAKLPKITYLHFVLPPDSVTTLTHNTDTQQTTRLHLSACTFQEMTSNHLSALH